MITVGRIEYSGYKDTLVYEKIKCGDVEYASGDFIKDWHDLNFDIYKHQKYDHIVFSSSLDHFFFDGADYDSAYLMNIKDDVWELVYIERNDMSLLEEHDIVDRGIEIFVPSGTKMTWEEYKQAYKDNL
jgi:hypothetical protein